MGDILTIIFILIGASVMGMAIFTTRKILHVLKNNQYQQYWRVLLIFMGLFLAGYILADLLFIFGQQSLVLILMGLVFLGGAIFVYIVGHLGYLTVQDLDNLSQTLEQKNQALQSEAVERQQRTVELEQSQAELAIKRDEALAASRTKSLFLANMSHELRTPLNAIIGYSEMLQEDADDFGYAGIVPDLEKIQKAGSHLLALVNDILDISKIEAGRMELSLSEFSAKALINDLVLTIQPLLDSNNNRLALKTENAPDIVYADLTKTHQIILNLLSNAAKFTDSGLITLVATGIKVDDKDWLQVTVSDTGIGMSPEQMGKIFGDFVQADASTTRRFGGTGLGLAISRRLCTMMGGNLTVTSTIGEGSTFTMQIPLRVESLIKRSSQEVEVVGEL